MRNLLNRLTRDLLPGAQLHLFDLRLAYARCASRWERGL